jgi:hypothetical protein
MVDRNDRALKLLQIVYDDGCRGLRRHSLSEKKRTDHFVETMVLQPSQTRSRQTVSWYLSGEELEAMRAEVFDFDQRNEEFRKLRNFMTR